ncbi:hypothetical protein FORC065_2647 [Yersinia enterocolitica]|nr:hypothetical protein FORC065_2647 [Yersinia enterocolitica]
MSASDLFLLVLASSWITRSVAEGEVYGAPDEEKYLLCEKAKYRAFL